MVRNRLVISLVENRAGSSSFINQVENLLCTLDLWVREANDINEDIYTMCLCDLMNGEDGDYQL